MAALSRCNGKSAVAESVPVPEVRNSIGVSDLRVSISVLDFLEAQRPHLNTLSGRIYACQEPAAAAELASVADCGGLVLQEVCAIEPSKLPEIVATDTAAFVTALFSLCSSKKPVMPLKEIQATWATLDPEQGRRVAKMQNAALSTLSCFQAILVRDNVRGPKITKLCRFPVERHLNAPGTETVTAFNTHFARTTLINSCAQTPIVLSWPTGPNVLTQLSSAGVPESALQTSDAKVATARALFRDLRLVLHDGPPHGAPWHGDSAPGVDSSPATTKRPRTVAVPPPSAAGGLPAPTPPGAMPGAFGV